MAVTRPDGTVEHVRVGTAIDNGNGFTLRLGELAIGPTPVAASTSAPRPSAQPTGGEGTVFPPYGRSKGMPIVGASRSDLEFYANGSRRSLGDPAKARWHDKERVLLAAIEAEIARQEGGGAPPPPAAAGEEPPYGDGDAGPPGDDDIPF